jgi:hypothetical protein
MNRAPRPPAEGLFLRGRGFFILLTLALSAVVLIAIEIEKLWIRVQRRTVWSNTHNYWSPEIILNATQVCTLEIEWKRNRQWWIFLRRSPSWGIQGVPIAATGAWSNLQTLDLEHVHWISQDYRYRKFVGNDEAISYIALKADKDRVGYKWRRYRPSRSPRACILQRRFSLL